MDNSREFVVTMAHNLKKPTSRFFRKRGSSLSLLTMGTSAPDMGRHTSHNGIPTLPLSPVFLADNDWFQSVQKNGLKNPDERIFSSYHRLTGSEVDLTPFYEMSHFSFDDKAARQPSLDESLERSPRSSTSTTSTMRHHANSAPVYHIDPMESSTLKRRQWRAAPSDDSIDGSVDMIAEQYRALLDDHGDLEEEQYIVTKTHAKKQPPRVPRKPVAAPSDTRPREDAREVICAQVVAKDRSGDVRKRSNEPDKSSSSQRSGSSDCDTLVGFEEDVIYFKPISFPSEPSPSPPPERQRFDSLQSTQLADPNDQSLQMCLALLMKQLSIAFGQDIQAPQPNTGSDTAALQVWVMIEAYERLRERVLDAGKTQEPQDSTLLTIFDSWLAALHFLHKSLVNSRGRSYPELEEDLD